MPRYKEELINKNALVEALLDYTWRDEEGFLIESTDEKRQFIEQWLPNVPIVDAKPVRHGHWVHGREISRSYIGDACVGIHYDKCWCSECNYTVEGYPLLWKYCPICGATMDEVKEDV